MSSLSRPPQDHERGKRRELDAAWLAYLAAGGDAGDAQALSVDDYFTLGIDRFNEGAYEEAHELFERAWIATPYPDRLLCLALSKLGAALAQRARGNTASARKITNDTLRCLAPLPGTYGALDVSSLRSELAASAAPVLRWAV